MKTIAKCALLLMLAAARLEAASPAHPLPPGMGRYILVLKVVDERPGTPKTITEPDVARLGGSVLSKRDNRQVIDLPLAAAKNLRADKNVAYVQRVWMGEPLDTWDERDTQAGSALKAQSDDVAGSDLSWSTGAFQYDPSGNIKAIGNDSYAYDTANRLVKAVVNGQTETYGYDSFGNLTQKATAGQASTIPVIDATSNRIAGEAYDAAGNVTSNGSRMTYEFDSVGSMSGMVTSLGQRRRMIYTAADERIGEEVGTGVIRWKIRDLNTGQVLREFQDEGSYLGAWEWTEDYVYAGGTLIGAETEAFWGGKRHFHLDHLGSVRMVTNESRMRYSRNDFYPFGTEQSSSVQEATNFGYWRSDPMKFTSHEREFYGALNVDNTDYLDYMRARFYSPNMGRFLSVDPILGNLMRPQSWNRYAYVLDNPVRFTDPNGLQITVIGEEPTDPSPDPPSPPSGDPWNGGECRDPSCSGTAHDFFMFISGAANEYGSGNLMGAGRQSIDNDWYQRGQLVGDAALALQGFEEIGVGLAGEAGGFVLDSTVIGALIGVPVQIASAGLVAHGATVTGIGAWHMMSGIKQRKEGKHGTFRGRESKRANDAVIDRVVRELGLSKDQRQRLHREIGNGSYSHQQIRDTAKAMFGK